MKDYSASQASALKRSAFAVSCAQGKRVMILNGEYRHTEALLDGIDEKKFSATLTLDSVSAGQRLCCCCAVSPPDGTVSAV